MTQHSFHSYSPAAGHGLAHDPMNAIIAPRPIGWVSTLNAAGKPNLAPYSFFNLFCYRPPILGFSSWGIKDSLSNVRATGEFVWNLASRALAEPMNLTSAEVDADVDEFALAGLAPLPSLEVAPPRVAASHVQMECKVTQIVRLETLSGTPSDNWMVFGEVVHVHIDESCLVDGVYQTARPVPITRGGGPADYFEITQEALFRMRRPPAGGA